MLEPPPLLQSFDPGLVDRAVGEQLAKELADEEVLEERELALCRFGLPLAPLAPAATPHKDPKLPWGPVSPSPKESSI